MTPTLPIRLAEAADNLALLHLSAEVPVSTPAFAYTLERSPDYFAFARVQALRSEIWVAGEPGEVKGLLSVSFDQVWLDGQTQAVAYTGDLRVAQASRGLGLGDRLMQAGIAATRQSASLPVFTCVMKDNPVGLKMNANLARDGVTQMRPCAEIVLAMLFPSLPGFGRRDWGFAITQAQVRDLPEMFALWQKVKSRQHLARAWTQSQWQRWIETTPGLALADYYLARNAIGELCGFFALWNQQAVRRVRLLRVHPFLRAAHWLKPAWVPGPGSVLPVVQILNLCIAPEVPKAFPALVQAALTTSNSPRLLGICLDQRDPLLYWLVRFPAFRSQMVLLSNYAFSHPGRGIFYLEIGVSIHPPLGK